MNHGSVWIELGRTLQSAVGHVSYVIPEVVGSYVEKQNGLVVWNSALPEFFTLPASSKLLVLK